MLLETRVCAALLERGGEDVVIQEQAKSVCAAATECDESPVALVLPIPCREPLRLGKAGMML